MATQLQDSLPVALSYSYGPETLNELLHRAFGSGADLIPKVEVSYGGAAYLASRDLPFGYWEPENPSISYPVFPAFLVPTIPIERTNFDDVTFVPGNNIAPNIWIKLTLPSGVEQTFQVATVPSHLPTYDDGRPTPGDIVAMAHGVVVEYGGTLAVNDCHNIATDIAAAAGATFDPMTGNTIDPTQNQEGGFWRIAYRGTDPGAISNWQTLVQPGDIVRMGWADNAPAAGKSHTVTVVEAADADGYIRVVDNGGLFPGAEGKIAEHWVKYDDLTNANSITIYRLASDQTYLVNGSDQADLLLGTRFNDRLVGGEGGDALYGGDGIDIADYHAAKAMVGADLMWPGLNLGEAVGDTYYSIEDLQGSAFGDHLNGDNSFNKIWGGRGDDQIAGRGGDDTIDGEEGTDTAYYAGRRADFAVSGLHANFTVTDRVAGREGTDTVYNVEYLHFDDGTYSIGDLIGDIAPAVTATDHGVRKYGDLAASSLFSVSDADGDAMTQYHFWDSTADATSGHFVVNGVAQGTNQTINVSAADLAHTTFQAGTTADDLWVQAFDGTKWSDWKEFHLTPPVNHAPEVTATDHGVRKYGDLAASSLFSVSDADGDAMTQYHFWDSTADATSGHFVVNGVAQGTNQIIDVSAAQLAQTTFQAGTTADDLWVQAYDGAVWSGWKEFHLTPPVNHAPVVTAADHGVRKYGDLAASSLFSVSDADGDAITTYRFYDATADATSGHFAVNGVAQNSGQVIEVSAFDFAQTRFQAATTADDLWVQVSDGTVWSEWKEFHLIPPVNHAPVVNVSDQSVAKNASLAASSLFSVSDADGDAMTWYAFWDSTADATSGHFVVNGVAQAAGQTIMVSAAQLAQTSFQTGATADDLWVQAYDGAAWSGWKEFHLTPPVNHAPVAAASDLSLAENTSFAASSLFSVIDADGDAMTQYHFWDSTADATSGHFAINGVAQGTNQIIDVSAADLAHATFQTGTTADALWVQAFDGNAWSAWKSFAVTAVHPITGTEGNDVLTGDGANNIIRGLGGDDVLIGKAGHDVLDGGAGVDTADYSASAGGVLVNLATGTGHGGDAEGDTLISIEQAIGSGFDDSFQGSADRGKFLAGDGNDTMIGGSAYDWFEGGNGNDTFTGTGGFMVMFGGDGNDTMTGSLNNGNYFEGGLGNDVMTGGNTTDYMSDVSGGDDIMHAGGGDDSLVDFYGVTALYGEGGNDQVAAAACNGLLDGGAGNDYVTASSGNYTLFGGAGSDTLEFAGFGSATFTGGADADIFTYRVNSGPMTVTDFQDGIDHIYLWDNHYYGTVPFESLTIADSAQGAVISWNGGSPMTLTGIQASQLTHADFVEVAIGNGGSSEIAGPSRQAVSFAGTGSLILDDASSFSGTVAGLAGEDSLDLRDISFATLQGQPRYSGDSSGGDLSVTDGVHSANIALLGNYMASTFVAASDGHGGTLISEAAQALQSPIVAQPHA